MQCSDALRAFDRWRALAGSRQKTARGSDKHVPILVQSHAQLYHSRQGAGSTSNPPVDGFARAKVRPGSRS